MQFAATLSRLGVSWVTLALALVLTAIVWAYTTHKLEAEAQARFERRAGEAKAAIEQVLQVNSEVLRGIQGFFYGTDELTRDKFRRYIYKLDLQQRYRGIQAFTFSRYVPAAQRTAFEAQVRRDTSLDPNGYPHFSVKPESDRTEHFVVDFLEPMAGNEQALGLDLGFEPKRRQAVERARDTGGLAATGRIELLADLEDTTGFLLALPVYRLGAIVQTREQRREAFLGAVTAVFRMNDLMRGVFGAQMLRELDIEIYDVSMGTAPEAPHLHSTGHLLFDSDTTSHGPSLRAYHGAKDARFRKIMSIDVGGDHWHLVTTALPELTQGTGEALPLIVLFAGVLTSGLLFGVMRSLATSRTKAETLAKQIAEKLTERENLLSTVFETEPECVKLVDADGRLLDMNPTGLAMIEADSLDEVRGKSIYGLLLPEHCPQLRALIEDVFKGESGVLEFEILGLKGTRRWMQSHAVPLRNRQGEITAMLSVTRDITESRKSEQELRRLNRTLTVLSECNFSLVHATDEAGLLDRICRSLVDTGGYRLAWVGFAEHDAAKSVLPVAYAGYEEGYLARLQITWADTERGRGPVGTAIRTAASVIARNIQNDPNFVPWREEAVKRGYFSAIALPLKNDGSVFGSLNIYARETEAFDTEEVKLLAELADDLAYGISSLRTAVERRQAEKALRRKSAVTELLESLAVAASEAATPEEAMRACLARVCAYLGWPVGHVVVFAGPSMDTSASVWHLEDRQRYAPLIETSDAYHFEAGPGGFVNPMLASKQPVWVSDLTAVPSFGRRAVVMELGIRAGFAFPVLAQQEVVAFLEFFTDRAVPPDELLLEVITNVGTQLGRLVERRRAEEAVRLRDRAVESSSNGIMISDVSAPHYPIIYVNPAFERITGFPAGEVIGRNARFLVQDDMGQMALEEIRAALRERREGEAVVRCFRKDGSMFWAEISVAPVRDEFGEMTHYVGIINDITERQRYEEQLEYQANYDALTGLANRNLLADRLKQTLIQAGRSGKAAAVLLLDLDRFKIINDTLGHGHGDELLKTMADRLARCMRTADTVARLGGDEFVIVMLDIARAEDVAQVAKKIIHAVSRPLTVAGQEMVVTASIGISLYPKDGEHEENLLKNADVAMYRVKEQGRNNFQFYAEEMNARAMERLTLETGLRAGLERGEFVLHYQPKVNLTSGQVVGAEALLRWLHPELGMISPAEFIPIAEETGVILPLGEWVLRAVCVQAKAWQEAGLPAITVAGNLSARQFRQENLVAVVRRALDQAGLESRYLELELTESMVMEDPEKASGVLRQLKSIGVKLSLDDFGTGYSSLSYLTRFPIDCLKIDRSFVRDIPINSDDTAIAMTVIAMAHSLKLRVTAEGVETADQLEFLRAQGCGEMQGYYFSRPLPAEEFAELLRSGRSLKLAGPQHWAEGQALLFDDNGRDPAS